MHYMKSENLWRETKSHNNKIKVVTITSAVTKITVGENEGELVGLIFAVTEEF